MDLLKRIEKDPAKVVPTLTRAQAIKAAELSNDLYHNKGTPVLSDDTYDYLVTYHDLETNAVVGAPIDAQSRDKVTLPVYMGSLDKIRADPAKIRDFQKRMATSVDISDKLDGISGLFVVDSPSKRSLYTRGDGRIGQDISRHLSVIKGIPKTKLPEGLVVRGELIISKRDYAAMSEPGANPRNTTSGLIAAKSPDVAKLNNVVFVAYSLIDMKSKTIPKDSFEQLQKLGFETPLIEAEKPTRDMDADYLTRLLDLRRRNSPYEIDGIVVSSHEDQSVLTGRNPNKAFAFKHLLQLETATVKVREVVWNVSKDGLLKPVVQFADPVRLSGVSIERATGFNAAYIRDNKIGPGAEVIIKRAGDVIPHIMSVVKASPQGPQMPPSETFEWVGKDARLIKGADSREHRFKEFWRFFEVLDVPGMGPAMAREIFDAGYETVAAVLKLSEHEFSTTIPGFDTDSKRAIRYKLHQAASQASCVTLMVASNAFGAGFGAKRLETILQGLATQKVGDISKVTVAQLEAIDGISTTTARKFIEGYKNYQRFLQDTRLSPLKCLEEAAQKLPRLSLKGSVVFSGFRDAALEAELESRGYTISNTVTKKTVYVVTKDPGGASSKLQKARDLGVKIVGPSDIPH